MTELDSAQDRDEISHSIRVKYKPKDTLVISFRRSLEQRSIGSLNRGLVLERERGFSRDNIDEGVSWIIKSECRNCSQFRGSCSSRGFDRSKHR